MTEMQTVHCRAGWVRGAGCVLLLALLATLVLSVPSSPPAVPGASASQASADAVVPAVHVAPATDAPSPHATATPPAPGRVPAVSDAAMAATTRVAFVELGALESRPGDTLDAFLVRTAQLMDLFTRTTGHEVCGVPMVADTGDAWRVRLTTNRSHIGCTMIQFPEPGFTRLGPDIHSHPRLPGGVKANAQDAARNTDLSCGQSIVVFDETFSRHDLARGPGYLVSRGRLLYQRGRQFPFQQRATFQPLADLPGDFRVADGTRRGQALPADAAADAAWENQDMAGDEAKGFPNTHCAPGASK